MSQLLDTTVMPEALQAPPDSVRPPRPRPAQPDHGNGGQDELRVSGANSIAKECGGPDLFPGPELIAAAHEIAEALYGCWGLPERIAIYKEVGARFGSEYRRILNIAAARWPELIPMVNDLPEWKALLSADLS